MRRFISDFLTLTTSLLARPRHAYNENIYDIFPACILAIDTNYHVTVFNSTLEKMVGVSRDQVIGRDVREILMGIIPLKDLYLINAIQTNTQFFDKEKAFTYNNRRFRIMVNTTPLYEEQGTLIGAASISVDITPIREYEHRIQHLESLAAIGQMAAGTVHEIRNPLTSIKGFTQLIQSRALRHNDNTVKEYCDLTIGEIDHVNNLLSDFLSLARPRTQRPVVLNMVKIVQDVLSFMYGEAMLSNITISANLPTEVLLVRGCIDKLKEVLINLCRNAFQAMPPGGTLVISITADDNYVSIVLTDNGCGMSATTLANIFKPFFTTKETGTGLGLSLCQRIILEHDGKIDVSSQVGIGSTFTVVLPRQRQPQ